MRSFESVLIFSSSDLKSGFGCSSMLLYNFIHPHQRYWYSDSPFARIHYFYTAGSGSELEGLGRGVRAHKKKLSLRKRHLFVTSIEKYVEDVKQGQKIDPDLVESIMKPSGLVRK